MPPPKVTQDSDIVEIFLRGLMQLNDRVTVNHRPRKPLKILSTRNWWVDRFILWRHAFRCRTAGSVPSVAHLLSATEMALPCPALPCPALPCPALPC
jgi:hypothetical protein